MQNSFFQAICRIGIFMICIRAIIHFRPNEAYEKYLRLLAGIMVMIQLFLPVGRIILGKNGKEAAEVLQQFRQELERGMEEAAESAAAADALLEQMTLEEVQRRLDEQASQENAADMGEGWEEKTEEGSGEEGEGENNQRDSRETGQAAEDSPHQGSGPERGEPVWGEAVKEGSSAAGNEDMGGGDIAIRIDGIKPVTIGVQPEE